MILKLKEWNDVVIVKLGRSGSTRTAQDEENGLNIWWCVYWQSLTVTAACLDNVSIYWICWNCPDFESVPIPIHCHRRILCPIFPILSTMPYFLLPCCVMWMLFIDFAIILLSDIFRFIDKMVCVLRIEEESIDIQKGRIFQKHFLRQSSINNKWYSDISWKIYYTNVI